MQALRFPRISRRIAVVVGAVCFVGLLLTAGSPLAAQGYAMGNAAIAARRTAAHQAAHQAAARSAWVRDGAWFQRLIYLYASGNAPIQRAAVSAGGAAGLSATQVTSISRAVRSAWVRMMTEDPASVGRTGVQPNYAGQQRVLAGLRAALARIAGSHYSALLQSTDRVYATTNSPTWLRANGLAPLAAPAVPAVRSVPNPPPRHKFAAVYATSFCILNAQNTCDTSNYVALPDAYVKYASLGLVSSIPTIYQPYYLPNGQSMLSYGVRIATSGGTIVSQHVPVRDVGPWNEDDNWWDPTDTTTTLPSNCPVSATTVSSKSLTNAAVDGICPGQANWRRVYYYLLYQHQALPFFQPAAYQPTGPYKDATAWPPVLPTLCPEAAAASVNNDGFNCAGSFPRNYNGNASAWLRSGSYNAPILNQAAIDVSPGVDALLGWTYPSSGFIIVDAGQLP